MSLKPWKVLESSYFRPRFRLDKCELSNGNLLNATVLELSAWVNILAITKNQEAVLIRQYRHGVEQVLWEIPGGVVEDHEDPVEGAKRELLEETGFTASQFVETGKIFAMVQHGEFPHALMVASLFHAFIHLERVR